MFLYYYHSGHVWTNSILKAPWLARGLVARTNKAALQSLLCYYLTMLWFEKIVYMALSGEATWQLKDYVEKINTKWLLWHIQKEMVYFYGRARNGALTWNYSSSIVSRIFSNLPLALREGTHLLYTLMAGSGPNVSPKADEYVWSFT